jgi:hypothetical protein
MLTTAGAKRVVRAGVALVAAWLAAGCGDDTSPKLEPSDPPPPVCATYELALSDGSCVPTGVPAERCAEGFETDGTAGCVAILPSDPCALGTMAVPGDSSCREIAPCGDGTWGDIPVDAQTQFVNGAYAGNDSDGSEQRPWLTIADAIRAADPGAIVAIAAGSYVDNYTLINQRFRLWGRCPAMVELIGSASSPGIMLIRDGADGSEIRNLAFAGPSHGLTHAGSADVLLENVWFHDNPVIGLQSTDEVSPGSIVIRRALFENNNDLGILVAGNTFTIEQVVVRDTKARPSDGRFGGAIEIAHGFLSHLPAQGTIRGSVLERNMDIALGIHGSNALIEGVLIRDTAPATDSRFGRGITIEADEEKGGPSVVTLIGSVIERSHDIGLFLSASDLLMQATVVRDVYPSALSQEYGRGVQLQDHGSIPRRSTTTIEDSLVERCHDAAIVVGNSDLILTGTLLRQVQARASDGLFGDGLDAVRLVPGQIFGGGEPYANIEISRSHIDQAARAALASFGAQVSIEAIRLSCSQIAMNGESQDGVDAAFVDGGENLCGCGTDQEPCKALSSMLEPPVPVP